MELSEHGEVSEMRGQAEAIFAAGVAAADPYLAVAKALEAQPVEVAPNGGVTLIVAVGKAAMRMAEAAVERASGPVKCIVITNYENAHDFDYAEVYAAGHPVPDAAGAKAAQHVITNLQALGENDRVLALISGGGSALMPAPVEGVSLADKAEVSRLLLGCGAEIGDMNMVRQQLSRLKGGGMLQMAMPAVVRALILSDVVGDDPRIVASGPTVGPVGSRSEAVKLLKSYGVWQGLPATVKTHLSQSAPDVRVIPQADNQLIGANPISVAAMLAVVPDAQVYAESLTGDVADAVEIVAKFSAESGKGITLFGGEATVKIIGDGLGGRNQELALRLALTAEKQGWSGEWVFLSGGTDGRDGPCDAAGGLVDNTTLTRMRAAGISPEELLANNDSYHALQSSDDLLMTGATGTNVADLQVLIRR
ncbi:MOFRL domain-containing protein [Marinosulfonomonas sp. PRT-SC04]|nr:MOFRL domain-containing protein [Marinosulfonomonas sp. PRT-SC04]